MAVDLVWFCWLVADIAMATAEAPRSHEACRNAWNPYHECTEFCFRVIAEQRTAGAGAADGTGFDLEFSW